MNIPKQSLMKQVRKSCIECCGDSKKEVLFCSCSCPLWFFRLGKSAQSTINEYGKKYEEIFKPDNFMEGGKYSPDKNVSELKL